MFNPAQPRDYTGSKKWTEYLLSVVGSSEGRRQSTRRRLFETRISASHEPSAIENNPTMARDATPFFSHFSRVNSPQTKQRLKKKLHRKKCVMEKIERGRSFVYKYTYEIQSFVFLRLFRYLPHVTRWTRI